jgi:hypothetical protein
VLNRDEAEKRLKQFQIKDWCGKRVAAVGKLPAPLAQVGRALLGRTQGLSGADALGIVLAAALDDGPEGEDVFETLRRSAGNEHGTGALGRHVTRALLVCGRPDAWEFAEQLLLRDQPEGGLRQVILETLDEAHPEAFRRMLRLILHQDLLRFRGTARAVDVWFGPSWHPPGPRSTPGVLEESLRQVIDQLLGPGEGFADLGRLTRWPPPPEPGQVPGLQAVVECCRDRILEIELGRGEAPTAASGPALALARCLGADLLLRLTQALGKKPFSGNADTSTARGEVLTHLVKVTHPRPADTPEAFTAAVKEAGPPRGRLLELAFTAPQWLAHVEHAVGWKGLREGVWWFLAHTPGASQVLEAGSVNRWERLIRERSPLTDEERGEGAVDVAWFRRAYEPLGKKRWDALAEASKCGSAGDGHRKATLLADVLLGRAKKRDLVAGVRDRKLKESVRLLGLLPLAGGKREADLLGRCKVLQGYRRYARGLGPMSREGALRAYRVGLENLARTAGYPDPLRLEWALEAGEVADLAAGPVAVTHQGVTVTLTLDEQAWAQISARQGNKPLKAIPAAVRKHPTIRALCEREAELKRQAARMRQALESAMCRGDAFTGAELRQLCAHPVPAALLRRLALVGEGGGAGIRRRAARRWPTMRAK